MRISLATGCFAAITPAHVQYLQAAAEFDPTGKVWVAIASAKICYELKQREAIDDDYRTYMLTALPFVAGVMIQETKTPAPIIRHWKPALWIKGGDYTIEQLAGTEEGRAVLNAGGQIKLTPRFSGPSTTELLHARETA